MKIITHSLFSVTLFRITWLLWNNVEKCCQNTPLQTVTIQCVMYFQCAQHYCNTQCVAVRTHRYRPSQYNLLCTFSVHNITVTHKLLLSEHTITDSHNIIIQTFITLYISPSPLIKSSLFHPAVFNQLPVLISCFVTQFPVYLHITCSLHILYCRYIISRLSCSHST